MLHRTESSAAYIHIHVHSQELSVPHRFLVSPVPLILQDAFAQGALRPLRLLSILHSHAITVQFYPSSYTGHYNQMTPLVADEILLRLCSASDRTRLCLFPLTDATVHARASLRASITFGERERFQRVLLKGPGFRCAPLLWRQAVDLPLCCDRVIMHVVNKHTYVPMCAVTAMSRSQ